MSRSSSNSNLYFNLSSEIYKFLLFEIQNKMFEIVDLTSENSIISLVTDTENDEVEKNGSNLL